jgi:hypothetical protein
MDQHGSSGSIGAGHTIIHLLEFSYCFALMLHADNAALAHRIGSHVDDGNAELCTLN